MSIGLCHISNCMLLKYMLLIVENALGTILFFADFDNIVQAEK